MKQLKLLLISLFSLIAFALSSQDDCGVQVGFTWEETSPGNLVFTQTTTLSEGWTVQNNYWGWDISGPDNFQTNPTQFFPTGKYNICLYVIAQNAETGEVCSDTYCQEYIRCDDLDGFFVPELYMQNFLCDDLHYTTYHGATSVWSFGDDSPVTTIMEYGPSVGGSFTPTITHPYENSGTYEICRTVSLSEECSTTHCTEVTVSAQGCEGADASFAILDISEPDGVVLASGTCPLECANPNEGWTQSYYWHSWSLDGEVLVEASETKYFGFTPEDGVHELCHTVLSMPGIPCASHCEPLIIGTAPCYLSAQITEEISDSGNTLLTAEVANGSGDYTFNWSDGQSGNSIELNEPTELCVQITDNLTSCEVSACYPDDEGNEGEVTFCGYVFYDGNGNGLWDFFETAVSGENINIGGETVTTDETGFWSITLPAGAYDISYCSSINHISAPGDIELTDSGNCGYYSDVTGSGMCAYNFGISDGYFEVCGKVYYDQNNDGQFDSDTENGIPNVQVIVSAGSGSEQYLELTDPEGNYCFSLPVGEYEIHVVWTMDSSDCTVSPDVIEITNASVDHLINDANFSVICEPEFCDLSVSTTQSQTVAMGTSIMYGVFVCNEGTQWSGTDVNFSFDDELLFFDYATLNSPFAEGEDIFNNDIPGVINWTIDYLPLSTCQTFWLHFNSAVTNLFGLTLTSSVEISPSCDDDKPSNNSQTIEQTVLLSYDPNNKLAYRTNHPTNPTYQLVSSLNSNQRIEYIINFQNTGEAPAVNVRVEDFISSDLDINSLEILDASHPMNVTLDGNEVNFIFNNIYLPDSTSNEAESCGYLRFAINAIPGLPAGHIISDEAAIYFDFNEAVITNDAAVEMINVTRVAEQSERLNILVYPNPMSDFVRFENPNGSSFDLRLIDSMGRTVVDKSSQGNTLTIDRGRLSSGIYFYEVKDKSGAVAKGKLAVR